MIKKETEQYLNITNYFFFRIDGINIVKTERKTTIIPIYGGASRIGWSPQYVGTLLEKLDD